MNKLTEIRDCLKVMNNPESYMVTTVCMAENEVCTYGAEWLNYLLSLLEEKDKALQVLADKNNWTRRWTENSAELVWIWTEEGKPQDIARKALNTSSNNEGEN